MKGRIWTVAVVAFALALALVGANIAYANAAESEFVTRNTTIDKGGNSSFQITAYNVTDNITVTNESGHELTRGEDYAFNPNTTTIEWLFSSETNDGENVTAEIEVYRHEQSEKTTANILSTAGGWIGQLLLVVALGFLIKLTLGGGGDF